MIKRIIQNFIRIIQKILITLLLTIVYFLIFGVTAIFTLLFNRRVLTGPGKGDNTFWVKAKGYECDAAEAMRQS